MKLINHNGPDADLSRAQHEDPTSYRCQGCGEIKTGVAVRIGYGWACNQECMEIAGQASERAEKSKEKNCLDNNKIYMEIDHGLTRNLKERLSNYQYELKDIVNSALYQYLYNKKNDFVIVNGIKYIRAE